MHGPQTNGSRSTRGLWSHAVRRFSTARYAEGRISPATRTGV